MRRFFAARRSSESQRYVVIVSWIVSFFLPLSQEDRACSRRADCASFALCSQKRLENRTGNSCLFSSFLQKPFDLLKNEKLCWHSASGGATESFHGRDPAKKLRSAERIVFKGFLLLQTSRRRGISSALFDSATYFAPLGRISSCLAVCLFQQTFCSGSSVTFQCQMQSFP
jgi:hypothetical protein